jgi:hypothetical protein
MKLLPLPRDYQAEKDGNDVFYVHAPSLGGDCQRLLVYLPDNGDKNNHATTVDEVARRLNTAPEPDAVSVTLEQAVAFVVAMVGHVDYGRGASAPKSPHMVTHLDAVLGHGKTPDGGLVDSWEQVTAPRCEDDWQARVHDAVNPLIDYLHAVVHALQAHREALRP